MSAETCPVCGLLFCGHTATKAVQRACDRCTQGVMDADNPHLWGLCKCPCHEVMGVVG